MTIWGFTGTREGMTRRQKRALVGILKDGGDTFHHGNCIGSDVQAQDLASSGGLTIISHPSNIPSMQANTQAHVIAPMKPPLERNHDIVDACDVLIAAPRSLTEEQRSGTWATVRYARKVGKPVIILEP